LKEINVDDGLEENEHNENVLNFDQDPNLVH